MNRFHLLMAAVAVLATSALSVGIYTFAGPDRESNQITELPLKEQPSESAEICDPTCAIERATALTVEQGPEAAIQWIAKFEDENIKYSCHAIHHAIGAAAARESVPEFPPLAAMNCEYGYLHGVIQAMASYGTYEGGVPQWLDFGYSYCNMLDDPNVQGDCLHALGHGAAVLEPNDLRVVLEYCASNSTFSRSCADGAMMEYADDVWLAAGWANWETGYVNVTTTFDSADASTLCVGLSNATVEQSCWARLGELMGPFYEGDPQRTSDVCAAAPTADLTTECLYGASALAVENFNRKHGLVWPPDDDSDAYAWVAAAEEECARWLELDTCIHGSIAPTFRHIYSAGLGHLVDMACDRSTGIVRRTCESALAEAKSYPLPNPAPGVLP